MKKSNEEVLARRINEYKKKREKIVKAAVQEHKENMPERKTLHFKFVKESTVKN